MRKEQRPVDRSIRVRIPANIQREALEVSKDDDCHAKQKVDRKPEHTCGAIFLLRRAVRQCRRNYAQQHQNEIERWNPERRQGRVKRRPIGRTGADVEVRKNCEDDHKSLD